jgi:hypothetical protein
MKNLLIATGLIFGMAACVAPKGDSPVASEPVTAQSVVDKYEISMRWKCEDAIKAQLRDPNSYEAEKVSYRPSTMNEAPGQIVDTYIAFRSRNGFGGMAGGFARCGYNASGEMVRQPNVVPN